MIRLLCTFLFLVSSTVFAAPPPLQPVAFEFKSVPLLAFAEATYKSILKRDYVISPEVLAMDRKITLSVKTVQADGVASFVSSILLAQGIKTEDRNGIVYFLPAVAAEGASHAIGSMPAASSSLPVGPSMQAALPVSTFRPDDSESVFFLPQNRPAEFLHAVVLAAFGPSSSALAGAGIVFTGSSANMKKMQSLAESVDSAPIGVDVAVSWVEVSNSSGSARGISLVASVLGARLGLNLGSISSGSALSMTGTNFQLVLDALNSDGRFKQVSNSRLVGDDRQRMQLTVGDETPTVSSNSKDNQGNPIQTIVYRPSGVIVDLLPKVLGNGRINLSIDGQVSTFKATSTGVNGSPTLIKREVKTVLTVGSGDVVVIGGLTDEQSTATTSRFPFLPDSWGIKNSTGLKTDLVLIVSAKAIQ